LGPIIAFVLGLNLPRSVLLAAIALVISSGILIFKHSVVHQLRLPRRHKSDLHKSLVPSNEVQPALVLVLLLIFGSLVTRSGTSSENSQPITHALEYLFVIPVCIAVAASPINQKTQSNLLRMAIAYSMGSVIYVAACLINTRLQGDFSLPSLLFRQAHNELNAPWGHISNHVNIRTVEQSMLFPISLLPISLITFFQNKSRKFWLLPVLTGIAALLMSRGFGSHFPLFVLLTSSGFGVASLVSAKRPAKAFINQHKNAIKIYTVITAAAAIAVPILTKQCITIDERFPRAIAVIRHLPLLTQQKSNLTFSYYESCPSQKVTFVSSAGDSLHNIFLDYSLQAGSVAGITLFTCTMLLSIRYFSAYFQRLKNPASKSSEEQCTEGIIASTISTIWVLWLFQPIASSNFSMFLASLYFLASSASNASLNRPQKSVN